jgi:hemoglobin-like flavoprotein
MTPDQIRLVQDSFRKVEPIAPTAAAQFYDILLSRNPSLRPMFGATDMVEQGAKLMSMLRTVVLLLDRPDAMLPVAHDLGKRHRGYGVQDAQYDMVGAALIETLSRGLDAEFDDAVEAAWRAAFDVLAATMKAAPAQIAANGR